MLSLVVPILHVVGLALFGILHTYSLHDPFLTDEKGLVVGVHECKCQENPLYILASRFQILLLQARNLCPSRSEFTEFSG